MRLISEDAPVNYGNYESAEAYTTLRMVFGRGPDARGVL